MSSSAKVTPTQHSPAPRRALALFLAFLGFYLLTTSGHFYAVDEETLFRVTESVVERHTFALPEAWGLIGSQPDENGPRYAQYTPGQSLAALPLYLVGKVLSLAFPPIAQEYIARFCVALFGSFVTAATVVLLYRLARSLGYGGGAALGLAAIYGLATTAWPHGRTFFAEPLTALLLLTAFYHAERGTRNAELRAGEGVAHPSPNSQIPRSAFLWTPSRRGRVPRSLVLSGMAAFLAVVVKPQGVIVLPVLGLYLLGRAAGVEGDWRLRVGLALRAGVAWGIGLAIVVVPFALYNTAIYGGPLSTGYGAGAPDVFGTPFLTGLIGLTVSSGKGLLWYTPPVVLAIVGWWPFWRRHRAEALACLGILLAHLAFYSRVSYWHGDGSWGPRYLMIALPFIMLPAVALLAGLRARRVWLAVVSLVVTLGVAIQLLGVLVNFDWYILRSEERTRHFTPAASPILVHARLLGLRAAEWRARAFPPPDSAALTAGFASGDSEGWPDAPLFPRWTTGAGAITLYPAAREPLTVKLTFFDHRPANLRAPIAILINDVVLPAESIERRDFTNDGEGWVYQFTVPASASSGDVAVVTLRSDPWNPKSAGWSERDEELGVYVHNVEVWREGRPFAIREALAIEPQAGTPRLNFWWANDDAIRHHLVDHWAWYAAVAGFGQPLTALWIAGYGTFAAALLCAGLALGWRSLPEGVFLLRGGRRRARAKRRRVGGVRERAV